MDRKDVIDELNSVLRGEISAVETYGQAVPKITAADLKAELSRCQASHEDRVARLNAKIVELGGEPAKRSGVWGAFAKALQGGAKLFGEKAAIAALEEGEDHGREDYKRALEKIADGDLRPFLEDLQREELRTHSILSTLKHQREARVNP